MSEWKEHMAINFSSYGLMIAGKWLQIGKNKFWGDTFFYVLVLAGDRAAYTTKRCSKMEAFFRAGDLYIYQFLKN